MSDPKAKDVGRRPISSGGEKMKRSCKGHRCPECESNMEFKGTGHSPDDNMYEIWFCPKCKILKTWGEDQPAINPHPYIPPIPPHTR